MTRISNLTALGSADGGDTVPILDVSATTTKKITKSAFLSDVVNGSLMAAQSITATKADFSVADATARLALLSPFEGLKCYQKDVDAEFIYDGSAWRRQAQWEELGRVTLGTAGDVMTINSIPTRKYLKAFFIVTSTGGTIAPILRFNNDGSTNYAYAQSLNMAAGSQVTSQSGIGVSPITSAAIKFGSYEVVNIATSRKLIKGNTLDDNYASATTGCNSIDVFGKWDDTSAAITRVDLLNSGGTGDFAIGSEFVVIGKD